MAECPTQAVSPWVVCAFIAAKVSHTRVAKSRARGARVARRGEGGRTPGDMDAWKSVICLIQVHG